MKAAFCVAHIEYQYSERSSLALGRDETWTEVFSYAWAC